MPAPDMEPMSQDYLCELAVEVGNNPDLGPFEIVASLGERLCTICREFDKRKFVYDGDAPPGPQEDTVALLEIRAIRDSIDVMIGIIGLTDPLSRGHQRWVKRFLDEIDEEEANAGTSAG